MNNEALKIDHQFCFPLYAASRLVTRIYQPFLDKIGLTYPQYLVLLVLWEQDQISVNEISEKLILNSNTLTPLLKRLEAMQIIVRKRSSTDERKVIISLTSKGNKLRNEAACIPEQLIEKLEKSPLKLTQLQEVKETLQELIKYLEQKL